MNSQPMGFYPVETIKEDARRFGVSFLNPCVNCSEVKCIHHNDSLLLGLGKVKDVGKGVGEAYCGGEGETRTLLGCPGTSCRGRDSSPRLYTLWSWPGAFDEVTPNRRETLWDAGLPVRPPRNGQRALPLSTRDYIPDLTDFTPTRENGRRVRRHGHLSQGSRHGVREADPEPRCPASP